MITDHRHKIKRQRIKKIRRKKYKDQRTNTKLETNVTYNSSYFKTNKNEKGTMRLPERMLNESLITEFPSKELMMNMTKERFDTTKTNFEELNTHPQVIFNNQETDYSKSIQVIFQNNSKCTENLTERKEQKTKSSQWLMEIQTRCGFVNTTCSMNTTFQTNEKFSLFQKEKINIFRTFQRNSTNKKDTLYQHVNQTKKSINTMKIRNESIQSLTDLDYCIHCKQLVGGESIGNITKHSVLCKKRNLKCLTCFKCNYTTRNIRQYERHCFHHHYSTTLTCPKCQHISNNIFTFVVHRRKHLNLRPYPCDVCGNHYITLHTLLRHKGKSK